MSNQSRQPRGLPIGGQFASAAHAESNVSLDLDDRSDVMAFLNAHRCHPALRNQIVSAEYPTAALIAMKDQVEAYDRARLAEYEQAGEDIRHTHRLLTEGWDALPDDQAAERHTGAAEHYAHETVLAANAIAPRNLPGPGETLISKETGRLYANAECAATERLAIHGGSSKFEAVAAATDAQIAKSLDTRDFTAANGIPFRARLVRRGESWGRNGALVADEDMVFFFDARFPDFDPMIGHVYDDRASTERNGQFVGNYAVSTLRGHRTGNGLDLDSGIPDWTIDADTYDQVVDWMDRRAPLRDNPFADCAIERDLRESVAAVRADQIGASYADREAVDTAFETRLREITRGWDSVDRFGIGRTA